MWRFRIRFSIGPICERTFLIWFWTGNALGRAHVIGVFIWHYLYWLLLLEATTRAIDCSIDCSSLGTLHFERKVDLM